jgi:hypothetical protein
VAREEDEIELEPMREGSHASERSRELVVHLSRN